jgi:hypothetical protein
MPSRLIQLNGMNVNAGGQIKFHAICSQRRRSPIAVGERLRALRKTVCAILTTWDAVALRFAEQVSSVPRFNRNRDWSDRRHSLGYRDRRLRRRSARTILPRPLQSDRVSYSG